jgi:hypothetical protein
MNDSETPPRAGQQEPAVGYSAFVSHASDDRAMAEAICEQLEASGFRCWIAPRDVRPGQDYPQEIIRGIELSKCLVLVLSDAANNSSFVRAEVERAYSKGKPVFPVRVEEVLPSRALELFISTKHWIDAWQGDLSAHAARLVAEMQRDPDLDLPLPGDMRRRRRIRQIGTWAAAAVGVVLVAGGVSFLMRSPPPPEAEPFFLPPTVFFMGDLLSLDAKIEPSYLLNDGHNDDGVLGIFDGDPQLAFYSIAETGSPELIYVSDDGQFDSFHQSSGTFTFEIAALPMRVVTCLTYAMPDGERHATLQGFNFGLPESEFATFPITEAAEPMDMEIDASFDCVPSAASYAGAQMASRAEPVTPRS